VDGVSVAGEARPWDDAQLPALSVIVGARNAADTLGETLEAVAAQAYPGWWEVVVVDNGSSDATGDVARAMADRLPNLRVLRPEDPGYQARGVNHGIEHAKGEVFVFLDADDVVGPDYLLHMGRALATNPFAGAKVDVTLLNPPEVRARRDLLQAERIDVFCGFRPAVIGAAMGARRDAVEAVGGMDPALPTQHDLDVSWRLVAAGLPAVFVPDAVLHYRYRTGAREIFRQERGYGEGEVVLFRKFRADGMPRRGLLRVAAAYLRLVMVVPGLRSQAGRARAATAAGLLVGRLEGSLRHRALYL
jgi:cellulose synthase/poly-beta-1,6-N-acetylglucosamine synthase-like glycosyltransferase